jgi:capsule polysaccharide export protein KpsC/LpsZ
MPEDLQARSMTPFSRQVYPLLGSFWNELFAERQLALSLVETATDKQRAWSTVEDGLNGLFSVGDSLRKVAPFTHTFDKQDVYVVPPDVD